MWLCKAQTKCRGFAFTKPDSMREPAPLLNLDSPRAAASMLWSKWRRLLQLSELTSRFLPSQVRFTTLRFWFSYAFDHPPNLATHCFSSSVIFVADPLAPLFLYYRFRSAYPLDFPYNLWFSPLISWFSTKPIKC